MNPTEKLPTHEQGMAEPIDGADQQAEYTVTDVPPEDMDAVKARDGVPTEYVGTRLAGSRSGISYDPYGNPYPDKGRKSPSGQAALPTSVGSKGWN